MAECSGPVFQRLLEEALELGRLDGRFAAAFEPAGWLPPIAEAGGAGGRCLGRTPPEFAELLWGDRSGEPPAGLVLNAPIWYAAGFAEGLAARRTEQRAADLARTRRVFT
jgi:hypothetical protein